MIPFSVKQDLYRYQQGRCAYCGISSWIGKLEIEHKHPRYRGGSDDVENLQLACTPCNMRKWVHTDEEFRHRYRRLLPADGSIPSPPISQDEFKKETKRTKAPPAVKAIQKEQLKKAKVKAKAAKAQQDAAGCLQAMVLIGVVVVVVLIASSLCGLV